MGVRGVNLGNWLVLEKWMGASPLASARAADDRGLIDELGREERFAALTRHYQTFITEDDFAWLAAAGVDLVRIPVPYHLFGSANHPPCVSALDNAFAWAQVHGLRVLVDLHTVPYSQNGFDNGGYLGLCAWSRQPGRVADTIALLARIGWRYAGHPALWGIEALNEPANLVQFLVGMPKWLRHDARRALASRPVSRRALRQFYQEVYARLRPIVGPEVNLVYHDHFALRAWEGRLPGAGDAHVWLDTHQYVVFAARRLLRTHNLQAYLRVAKLFGDRVAAAARHERPGGGVVPGKRGPRPAGALR